MKKEDHFNLSGQNATYRNMEITCLQVMIYNFFLNTLFFCYKVHSLCYFIHFVEFFSCARNFCEVLPLHRKYFSSGPSPCPIAVISGWDQVYLKFLWNKVITSKSWFTAVLHKLYIVPYIKQDLFFCFCRLPLVD